MYNQIKNTKGEKLYIFIISNTNPIKPYTYINTWEKCLKKFEECTKELNNDIFFAQIIHKNISEETHTANALIKRNNKNWGYDFFNYITINPLYTEAW